MSNQSRKDILQEKQCVILKGRRDGISVLLDGSAEFDLIKDVLRKRVAGSRSFFEGAKTAVTFKGRQLSDFEEQTLRDIIQFESTLDEEIVDIAGKAGLLPASPPGEKPIQSETFFYQCNVRSGQIIRQNGSVVVVGDVNPGAIVKATGNVIVLGALRGLAWAGAPSGDDEGGDKDCYVSALDFKPTQIRIARVVSYIEDQSVRNQYNTGAWAYIQGPRVFIAPL